MRHGRHYEDVWRILDSTDVSSGIVTLFVAGSTGALTAIEYEPGLTFDFPAMLERAAHSPMLGILIGPSLTVSFNDRRLTLGTWQ